jgi:hypothetical protein
MDDHDGADAIERAWRDGLKPDPLLTVSDWADRYRVLSQRASSEPGRWRTERTPYLRAIMDCLSPASPVQRVALMKGAQIGGTECGNCWIGYVAEVHELCALAGRDDLAAGFVAKATPVAQVRRALLEARAAEDEATAVRSQVRPASVEPSQPAIDTAAIYAARNQNVR